ncbi:MAG: sigma-70 family RNA polymerase sigma factor [Planctomycetota bacterium]
MTRARPEDTDLPNDRDLIEADAADRPAVLNRLLDGHRGRVLRMVQMRLHPAVRARVDASDVIQEAYLEIHERLDDYVANPRMSFFLWARRIAGDRLLKAHRFHMDAKRRDVRRQERGARSMPDVSTVALIDRIESERTSPSGGAQRAELHERLVALLDELSDIDREILCMRHFEELSNEEVAQELGIGKHAASKRYIRALQRLRTRVGDDLPGA